MENRDNFQANNTLRKIGGLICLLSAILASILLLWGVFSGGGRLPSYLLVCFFLSFVTLLLAAKLSRRGMRLALWTLFGEYIIILCHFTLFDPFYGRSFTSLFSLSSEDIREYLSMNMNLIPFETINLFIRGFLRGNVGFSALCRNILGNLIAFAPFGFFLRLLKPSLSRGKFLILIFSCVFAVEFLQLILMAGSFDTDDFLLNILGAYAFFALPESFFGKGIFNFFRGEL